MAMFENESVADALERALLNGTSLRARDSAAVAAARKLARKIDAWNHIIEWALDDAAESGGRPAVPANDNVSLVSFLKYLEKLGLVSRKEVSSKVGKPASAPKSGIFTLVNAPTSIEGELGYVISLFWAALILVGGAAGAIGVLPG